MLFLVYQGLFRVFPDVVGDNNSDSVGEILMGIGERGISNKLFEFVESGSKLIGLGSSGLGSNIIVSFIRGLGGVGSKYAGIGSAHRSLSLSLLLYILLLFLRHLQLLIRVDDLVVFAARVVVVVRVAGRCCTRAGGLRRCRSCCC